MNESKNKGHESYLNMQAGRDAFSHREADNKLAQRMDPYIDDVGKRTTHYKSTEQKKHPRVSQPDGAGRSPGGGGSHYYTGH